MNSVYNNAMVLADDQVGCEAGHTGTLHIDLDELKRWNKQCAGRTVRTVAVDLVKSLGDQWNLGIIDKWSFYQVCAELRSRRWITIEKIAEASGIKADVISMRLAYLRAM